MSTVYDVNASTAALSQYQRETEVKANDELGKNEFLQLMVAQMQYQDPLAPQSNAEFVAQLAQFSSVEGLENLNSTVTTMSEQLGSSQALQASTLVGRKVAVPSSTALLDGSGEIVGLVSVPASTPSMQMVITDSSGAVVREYSLGAQSPGEHRFVWDGKNADGDQMPEGQYRFTVTGTYEGQAIQYGTYLGANVDSVTLGQGMDVTLNLAGIGAAKLSDIRQIID